MLSLGAQSHTVPGGVGWQAPFSQHLALHTREAGSIPAPCSPRGHQPTPGLGSMSGFTSLKGMWDLPVPLLLSGQHNRPSEGQQRGEVRSQDSDSALAAPSPPLPASFRGGSRAGTLCGLLLITQPGWAQGCSHRSQHGSGCPGQSAWELPSTQEHTFNRTNLAPCSKQLTHSRGEGAGEGVLQQLSACLCSSSHSSSLGEET